MNIINWLRTPIATLIVLCSALLAQLPHAADVFRLVVMGDGWGPVLHSYTYAVALELAVLLFVVQRRNVESYLFAGVSILVNLSYYHLHGVALWTVAAAPAWLISIALPAAIAQYSHLIAAATDAHVAGVAPAAPAATPRRNWRQWWRKDAAPATVQATSVVATAPAATAQPAPAATWVDAVDDALAAIVQQDARTTALQMASEGVPVAQIAAQVDAKPATVRSWIARERAKRNGKAVQA
jgi:DNA-directed RNA polymerase specialized sigma24 family protein